MKYDLKIEPDAEQDIIEVASWYNQQKVGLGIQFLEAFEKILKIIEKNPYQYAIKYKNSCSIYYTVPVWNSFYYQTSTNKYSGSSAYKPESANFGILETVSQTYSSTIFRTYTTLFCPLITVMR